MSFDLVGKTFGQYQLQEVIGEGGMAVVYKAQQISLNRLVAVKVLYHYEDNSLVRFEREAKAIASLRHRNILIVYEYGEAEGSPFIAMEYVEGGTLEDRLDGTPMDWRRVIELTIPIAEALDYAHSHGIIHRDVKPSNILMPQEDWPVLADFGLVKHDKEQVGLTLSGTFVGTPSYIAPEQARDAEPDFRVDMYALGVIMFEMITGRIPFDYDNPNKILLAHVKEQPPAPSKLNPDCPSALEKIILRTLEKSPDDRYADMQAMIKALKAALTTSQVEQKKPVTSPPPPVDDTPPPQPQPEDEEDFSGFLDSIRGLFSRRSNKKNSDSVGRTSPRPQINLPDELPDEEEVGQTIQINLKDLAALGTPHLTLKDKNTSIQLPNKEVILVGRTYRNNIVDLDLEPYGASKYGVSRQHARFVHQGDTWHIEDLGSLNGTFVNNKEVRQGKLIALKSGDKIRFSHMAVIFIEEKLGIEN